MKELRAVEAGNAGLFALGGTRTFVVGEGRVAVVDPGPDDPAHLDAVAREVGGAKEGVILLTHRHPDHAAGAPGLAERTGFAVRARTGGDAPLRDDEEIATDAGPLRVVSTPGHSRDHAAFFLPRTRTLLVGDLLLGEGDTTWVGEYPGCVADYLGSLDRIEALGARRLLPAHGPPLEDPAGAIARFRRHRLARIEQVARVLERAEGGAEETPEAAREQPPGSGAGEPPGPGTEEGVRRLVEAVYGPDLPEGLRTAAAWSIRAILEHLGVAPFPAAGAPVEGGDRLAPPS